MEIIIVIYLLCDTKSENRMSVQVVVGNEDSNQKSRDFHFFQVLIQAKATDRPTPERNGLAQTGLSHNATAGDQPKARQEQGIKEWMNLFSS